MLFRGEPIPRPAPDVSDDLATLAPNDGTTVTGTGALDVPIASLPYHRAPFGSLVGVSPQDLDLGIEVPQAGAGRPIISARLTFPDQSVTPDPDRRRIARPMPTAARDEDQVIR